MSSRSDLAAKTLKLADFQPHQVADRRQPLSNKHTRRMEDEAAIKTCETGRPGQASSGVT